MISIRGQHCPLFILPPLSHASSLFLSYVAHKTSESSTKLGLSLKSVDPPQAAPVAKTQARWSHEYM